MYSQRTKRNSYSAAAVSDSLTLVLAPVLLAPVLLAPVLLATILYCRYSRMLVNRICLMKGLKCVHINKQTSNTGPRILDTKYWIYNTGHQILDLLYQASNTGPIILGIKYWTYYTRHQKRTYTTDNAVYCSVFQSMFHVSHSPIP